MNKFKFYFILIITSITIFSCSKNEDSATVEPIRDYQTQYDTEIKIIEDYLKTNYITVTDAPGETNHQDVIIQKLDADHTVSIWDQTKYPLKSKIVSLHDIEYTLYYLELRQGQKDAVTRYLEAYLRCNVDGVLTSYRGTYLSQTTATDTTPSTITATQLKKLSAERLLTIQHYLDGEKVSRYSKQEAMFQIQMERLAIPTLELALCFCLPD